MKAIKTTHIVGIKFREAPLIHPVFSRSFKMNMIDTSDLNAIANMASKSTGDVLPHAIARSSPGIIGLSAPTTVSAIPNGYDTLRCSFTVVAVVEYVDDSRHKITIEGYTDNNEIKALGGATNKHQPLYMVSLRTEQLARYNNTYSKLLNSSSMMLPDKVRYSNREAADPYRENPYNVADPFDTDKSLVQRLDQTWKVQEPNAVFANMVADQQMDDFGNNATDVSNTLVADCVAVDTSLSSPYPFTTKIVNTYMGASSDVSYDTDMLLGDLSGSLLSACHSRATNTVTSDNDLILALRRRTDGVLEGQFTIADLESVDPTFTDDRIKFYRMDKTEISDYRNYTSEDGTNTPEGEVASTANMLINNFMGRTGVNGIQAVITNASTDLSVPYVIQILSVSTNHGIDKRSASAGINMMIRDELCPMVSAMFDGTFVVKVNCTTLMESRVEVELDGNASVVKVFPGYASTLSSPVLVAPGFDTGLVTGFKHLIDILDVPDRDVYAQDEFNDTDIY